MIPIDYQLKVGDKLIMNEHGTRNGGYGQTYIEDCLAGVTIIDIKTDNHMSIYYYNRTDGTVCHVIGKPYWSSAFHDERREHFDLVIEVKIILPVSRLALIDD